MVDEQVNHQKKAGDMSDTEPTFVVKLTGIRSPEDIERYERGFREQLPGRVVVVDGRVEDIYKMTRLDVERLAMRIEEVMGK